MAGAFFDIREHGLCRQHNAGLDDAWMMFGGGEGKCNVICSLHVSYCTCTVLHAAVPPATLQACMACTVFHVQETLQMSVEDAQALCSDLQQLDCK